MTVRRRQWTDPDGKQQEAWIIDITFRHTNGRVERIRQASQVNTRRGAEETERQIRDQLLKGTYKTKPAETPPLLKDFAPEFLAAAKVNNKPSTYYEKETALNAHIVPFFGEYRLDKIGGEAIEKFKAHLKNGVRNTKRQTEKDPEWFRPPLQPKTINNILTILGTLLGTACEWGRITKIPRIKKLPAPPPPFDFLSFEEAIGVREAAPVEWKAMVITALNTGLRLGELRALEWQDVDLSNGRLMVRQSIWDGKIGTPKSGKSREIPLNTLALQALKDHRARIGLQHKLVFPYDGTHLGDRRCEDAINQIAQAAGVGRRIGWHVLRHTFASHLVMRGIPLKTVQELLGHASISTTERYAHLSPHVKREAVGELEKLMANIERAEDPEVQARLERRRAHAREYWHATGKALREERKKGQVR